MTSTIFNTMASQPSSMPQPSLPPRLVIPKQTVSSNTRPSNKKPSNGFLEPVPVTPVDRLHTLSPTNNSERVGRWSDHEHEVFLEGLHKYGKQWKTIANMIGTRTVVQVRTHAQKYFQKVEKTKMEAPKLSAHQAPAKSAMAHYNHAQRPKSTSGSKRKSFASSSPGFRKSKQIKSTLTSYTSSAAAAAAAEAAAPLAVRKVSLGSVSPSLEAIDPKTSLGPSSATSSENLSTVSPVGVSELDLLEPSWATDAMFLTDDYAVIDNDLREDPLEWLIDGGIHHLPESSLTNAPMFPEFGSDELSSDIHLMPNAVSNNDMLKLAAGDIETSLLYNMADPKVTAESLYLGESM